MKGKAEAKGGGSSDASPGSPNKGRRPGPTSSCPSSLSSSLDGSEAGITGAGIRRAGIAVADIKGKLRLLKNRARLASSTPPHFLHDGGQVCLSQSVDLGQLRRLDRLDR